MATSTNKSNSETSTKSQYILLLFLVLLLISPLCARPAYFSKVPIHSSYRQLFSPSSPSATENLHPFSTSSTPATTSSATATDRQFKAAAHEVPSGPNPESNK
ncbi:hypothetical protein REPUB_Repub15cG0095100 [Reevesia pubescens]